MQHYRMTAECYSETKNRSHNNNTNMETSQGLKEYLVPPSDCISAFKYKKVLVPPKDLKLSDIMETIPKEVCKLGIWLLYERLFVSLGFPEKSLESGSLCFAHHSSFCCGCILDIQVSLVFITFCVVLYWYRLDWSFCDCT